MNAYERNGFKCREDYLHYLADENDMPYWVVESTANELGPDEDFDGLVVMVEDWAYAHS
jgi:hypothetical protein